MLARLVTNANSAVFSLRLEDHVNRADRTRANASSCLESDLGSRDETPWASTDLVLRHPATAVALKHSPIRPPHSRISVQILTTASKTTCGHDWTPLSPTSMTTRKIRTTLIAFGAMSLLILQSRLDSADRVTPRFNFTLPQSGMGLSGPLLALDERPTSLHRSQEPPPLPPASAGASSHFTSPVAALAGQFIELDAQKEMLQARAGSPGRDGDVRSKVESALSVLRYVKQLKVFYFSSLYAHIP